MLDTYTVLRRSSISNVTKIMSTLLHCSMVWYGDRGDGDECCHDQNRNRNLLCITYSTRCCRWLPAAALFCNARICTGCIKAGDLD